MGLDLFMILNWMTLGLVAGIVGIWTNKLHATPFAVALAVCFGPVFMVLWVGDWWETKKLARESRRSGLVMLNACCKKAEGSSENTRNPSAQTHTL